MGYTYNVELPASGTGNPVPINVTGQTQIASETNFQIAYDENGFNTNQFGLVIGTQGQLVLEFPAPTVLWVRQDPGLVGSPETTLYVWTDIGSVSV